MSIPSILYVEDHLLLMHTIKDVLEMAGWHVQPCSDVGIALGLMETRTHYNLLILDNELHGITGLELIRRARQIPHLHPPPSSSSPSKTSTNKPTSPEQTPSSANPTTSSNSSTPSATSSPLPATGSSHTKSISQISPPTFPNATVPSPHKAIAVS